MGLGSKNKNNPKSYIIVYKIPPMFYASASCSAKCNTTTPKKSPKAKTKPTQDHFRRNRFSVFNFLKSKINCFGEVPCWSRMKAQLFLVEFSKPLESLVLSGTKALATLSAKRGTSVTLIVFVTTIARWVKAGGKSVTLPGGLVSVPTCSSEALKRCSETSLSNKPER